MERSYLDRKKVFRLKEKYSVRCLAGQGEKAEATYFTKDVSDRITVDLLQRIVLIEESQAEWPEETSDLIDELWNGKCIVGVNK